MALLLCDAFDTYTVAADMAKRWFNPPSSITVRTGRHSSNAIQPGTSSGGMQRIIVPGSTTVIVGVAIKLDAPPATPTDSLVALRDGLTGFDQVGVRFNGDGSVTMGRGSIGVAFDLGVTYGTTAAGIITPGTFQYLEIKVTFHATLGSLEVRVSGTTILTATNVNTAPSGVAGASLLGFNVNHYIATGLQLDDLYVCDSTGSANTTFLGDVRVDAHLPNGAGATTGWTPSTGANYQCVDESTANDDTDYVSTTAAGGVDTYALENYKNPGGAIKGVQLSLCARATDVAACQIAPVVRHGSTDYVGTPASLTVGYSYAAAQMYNTNPGTSAAWTESDLNALEVGVKKIA